MLGSLFSIIAIIVVVNSATAVSKSILDTDFTDVDVYPTHIPHFPVRLDHKTKRPVERGRFNFLLEKNPHNYNTDLKLKVTLATFKEALQCSKTEPTMNGKRGTIDIMKMLPPTKEMIALYATRATTGNQNYREVAEFLERSRLNPNDCHRRKDLNLLRVINNTLYMDWPWCFEMNSDHSEPYPSMAVHLHLVLGHISDMKDSVFLQGAEQSKAKFVFPFPLISNSPDFRHSDIPWPWVESLRSELILYQKALASKNFTEEFYRTPYIGEYKVWSERYSKAAYFGSMIDIRSIFFSQAIARPDLIEARWTCGFCGMSAWNPTSQEDKERLFKIDGEQNQIKVLEYESTANYTKDYHVEPGQVGYVKPLTQLHISQEIRPKFGHYKYLVVLIGINGRASSGRLASLLAYSGAVLLIQLSEFEYHFSARLKPWVHYVPLSYSAADIASKIEWLRAHDDLAQQIAENARNFGLSYLRLEDQFCYVATALEVFAELEKDTNATSAWDPKPLKYSGYRRRLESEEKMGSACHTDHITAESTHKKVKKGNDYLMWESDEDFITREW